VRARWRRHRVEKKMWGYMIDKGGKNVARMGDLEEEKQVSKDKRDKEKGA
jgi:hypothetical protein